LLYCIIPLTKILEVDLTGFIDENKEDFLIEINGLVFIGEIKGTNDNVKSKHISQLDTHYQSFLEERTDIEESNTKALLIINHQKNKNPDERVSINEKQVTLAKRNKSYIIETTTLLKIFEKHLLGRLNKEKIIKLLFSGEGLLAL